MSAPKQNNDSNQAIPANSLLSLEVSSNRIPIRTVDSIVSEYINEQLPQANSFIFNNLIGEIETNGKLPEEDIFYREYKNMVDSKAKNLIQDVMKSILNKEEKWDDSYKSLSSKELYEKLNEEDQVRFKELFTKTENWKEQTSKLFDPGNKEALQEQLYIKIKKELARNSGALYATSGSVEAINTSRRISEELYKDISLPTSVGYTLLKNNNKKNAKEPKVLMIHDNRVIKNFIHQALIDTFSPDANIELIHNQWKMSDIVEKSPEKYQEFAEKVKTIIAAYDILSSAISNIDSGYRKQMTQDQFYKTLNAVMPNLIEYGYDYLHNNQADLSKRLAKDLVKENTIGTAKDTLDVGPNALKRISRKVSKYSETDSLSKFYIKDSEIDTASSLSDRSLSRSSSMGSMVSSASSISEDEQAIGVRNDKKVLPTLIQPFKASESILEHLMYKYDELASKVENESISLEDKRHNLYTLNAELFELASTDAEILPINKLSSIPEKVYIKDIENNPNVIYSNIGINGSANSLVMSETTDGKIYFDEKGKSSNKFTGVIFVKRINTKTVELLGAKDVIYYKEGEVVKFIEGLEGESRLGQIEQFKQAKKSLAHEYGNKMKSPEQVVGDIVKEVFSKTKEKLSENYIAKLTDNLLKTHIDYSDKKALNNQISNSYNIIEKSLYNIETTRGKRISPIIMQNSLEQLLPVLTKMEPQYLTESSEKIVIQLKQQLYQNRSLFSTAIGSGFKINKNGLEKVAQNMASSYESESKLFDQNNNLVNAPNSAEQDNRGKQEYKQFKVSTGMQLSEKEQKYVLDSLGRDSGLVADNIIKIVKDHGNYNVFISELGKIIQNNKVYKQENVLSAGELKVVNLNDTKQKELFDNTLKSIKTHDVSALQEAVNKSLRELTDIGKNNTQTVNAKTTAAEKPVINLPPKLPKVPSLSQQEPKNAGMMLKGKRYMAPMVDSPDLSKTQPSVKPQIVEPKQQNVSNVPTFSTFKSESSGRSSDIGSGPKLSNLERTARISNSQEADKYQNTKDLKTPEQVRNFTENKKRTDRLKEKADIAQEQQEYIKVQNNKTPAPAVRNTISAKDEYALSAMKPFADEIMNKVIIQAKISDKGTVEELKNFLRKELNQYVDNTEKDNILRMMDMIYIPEMAGRKENFQQFIANALVSINKQNKILNEDMLVDKMELFHSNLTRNHIGEQRVNKSNVSSSKKLSEREMQYVLDNLSNKILAEKVIQIIRDHSNYNIFAQEVCKIMDDNKGIQKEKNILTAKEIKYLNLNDPNQLDLLKNTVDVINSYDLKGLKNAIKMAVVGKQVKEINHDIDPSTVPPHPNSKLKQGRE